MSPSLVRIMLFVQNVEALSQFYVKAFEFEPVETIADEWAVLRAGGCELALHRVGEAWRDPAPSPKHPFSNVKLVFRMPGELETVRERLTALGASMDMVTCFPGAASPHCDGRDPEGNVFQLVPSG